VEGDVVLRHNAQLETDMSTARKLAYKWLGPYRIRTAVSEKGTYILEEFDETRLPGTYAGNCLKKFVKREGFYEPVILAEDLEAEEEESEKQEENEALPEEEAQELSAKGSFEILVPQLSESQKREYILYDGDEWN
jgi:hypothetical protein